MRELIDKLFGQDGGRAIQMIGALLIVVVLIVLFAWIMRRMSGQKSVKPARKGERVTARLAVVDAAHVDGQRRLVLVRRDDVEHLVMIGGPNDVLIEPRIVRGQPLGGQRQVPQTATVQVAAAQQMPTAMMPPIQAPQQAQQAPSPAAAQVRNAVSNAMMPQQTGTTAPPPFVESVTSPAASLRASPLAADLRAAVSESRRTEPPRADAQPMPRPATRPAPQPDYDDATAPVARPAYQEPVRQPPQPAYERPTATIEDMVAAGLEEAMLRPSPAPQRPVAPPPSRAPSMPPSRSAMAQDPRYDAPAQRDSMSAHIDAALQGISGQAPARPPLGGGRPMPQRAPLASPTRDEPPARDMFYRAPAPSSDLTRPATRMPAVSPPPAMSPRAAPPQSNRPVLVTGPDALSQEPTVAVMPSADAIRGQSRNDPRKAGNDIEDEMARLLSELTGTAGR